MRFSAHVDNHGTLNFYDLIRLSKWLAERKGQRLEVELRDEAAVHSDRQRGYWFGCVVQTVNEIWTREKGRELPYHKDAIHGALLRAFGTEWLDTPMGKERPSFASMSKAQVSKLIDGVAEWLVERYAVVLPSPEEWTG